MAFRNKIYLITSAFLLAVTLNAYANPEGESVAAGNATFDRSTPNTLTVNTTSNNTIINYNSFSIAGNETTRFNQPGSDSAVLNRVTGVNPSEIYGTLSSNGKLFLVNPNGIIFGPGSSVNAPAIVASTLDIANEDFLRGSYNFFKNGESAFIINQGRLASQPGGFIALLSQAVNNQGLIIADLGTVALAAGEKMTLALDSLSQISVVIDDAVKAEVLGPDGLKMDSAIKNSGTIQANGGKVILTAKILNNVFDYAVNNSGVIQAGSIQEHDGVIELTVEGAPVINTGIMAANSINIKVSDADFLNKGSVIANLASGLATGNVAINAENIFQAGSVTADNEITFTATHNINTDPAVNSDPAVIIQGKRVNLSARQFGSVTAPLNIKADNINLNRIQNDINILNSLGIGTSILLRGPPDGFGAIIYNPDTNLTLEAPQGAITLSSGVILSADNLTLIAKDEIFSQGLLLTNHTLSLLSEGPITSLGTLKTGTLVENGASFKVGGIFEVGRAYLENADHAINYTTDTSVSGTINDAADIIINPGINISLGGDTSFSAGTDFVMGTGSFILGGGYNLYITANRVKLLGTIGTSGSPVNNLTITGRPINSSDNNSIQTAINAIGTVSGTSTINVATGAYNENPIISKSLSLLGPNSGINPNIGSRLAEAVITGQITINHSGVTVNGFTVTNPSGTMGIYVNRVSNISLQNNILTNIGTTFAGSSAVQAVYIYRGSTDISNISIQNSQFTNIGSGNNSSSNKAIFVGDTTSSSVKISNVTIDGNSISGVFAKTTLKGAYGILVNHLAPDIQITNNTIDNLDGLWAHAIGLEGDTPNAVVTGNAISNVVSHNPVVTDGVGVFFETNPSLGTVTVQNNSFATSVNFGVAIHPALLVAYPGLIVNASGNWWGTNDAAAVAARVSSNVDYTPWLNSGVNSSTGTGFQGDFSVLNVSAASPQAGLIGRIQEGINLVTAAGTVNVTAGMYNEAIVIDKPLTLLGATHNIAKDDNYSVPANYAWDTSVESVIVDPNSHLDGITVDIVNTNDVTFKGFIVHSLTTNTSNRHLLRVYAYDQNMANIVVSNNIIGPNTKIGDEANFGRMGLYLVPYYGNYAIKDSTFSYNKIFGSGGNGNNIFVWGSYAGHPLADMTGTVIEYNDIYGSRRSGIELSGGVKNLTISNNKIHDNGFAGDDALTSPYKYGIGIALIRIGSESSNPNAPEIDGLIIKDNQIYNNKKFGIYMGPMNTDHIITGNDIHNNGWDGIRVDLTEVYHGGLSPVYNFASNIAVNYNSIYDNGFGARVVGAPTNGFVLDASANWWGSATGPNNVATNPSGTGNGVSDNVDYSPWWGANYVGDAHAAPWNWYLNNSNGSTIQEGIGAATAGDTINVMAGTYNLTSLININKNGLKILGPQANVDPRISFGTTRTAGSAAEAIVDGNGTLGTIFLINADDVVINGFEVRNGTGDLITSPDSTTQLRPTVKYNIIHNSSGDEGVQLKKVIDALIEYNHIYTTKGDGINIGYHSTGGTIQFNEVHDIYSPDAAIYVYETPNVTIKGNKVYDVHNNDGIKLGSKNGSDAGSTGGLIKDNLVYNVAQDGIAVYMSNTTVEGNEIYNSTSQNGAIYVAYAVSGINITGNTVHDNTLDITKWGNPGAIMIGPDVNVATVTVNYNKIYNNTPNGLTNKAAGILDATKNYWGDATGPSNITNPHGLPALGNAVSGNVNFMPWYATATTTPLREFVSVSGSPVFAYSDTIQGGVDAAISGSTVNVAAGTYPEQVTIQKSLSLIGAGEATTIIQAPAVRTGTVTQGTTIHDYILAAYAPSSTIDVRIEGFTFDANSQNKMPGTAQLDGVFFRDVKDAGGTVAGLFSSTIHNFAATPDYEAFGIVVYGDSLLTLNDNNISDYTRDGISINRYGGAGSNPNVTISGNTVTGSAVSLNGINISGVTAGTVMGNTVTGNARSAPWAGGGIVVWSSTGITITGNHVDNNFYGIDLEPGTYSVTISGNELTGNIKRAISLNGADNNTVSGNTITGPASGTDDTAIGLANGSTGNIIGGTAPADGNTITMATSGSGNLYAIYMQSDVGTGSNTIQYNTITGGKRAVQFDGPPGITGTTTVSNNTISGQEFGGIVAYNNGDLIITDNTLTDTVRPMEFFGPRNLTITGNTINGSTYSGINLGSFSGTASIEHNTIYGVPAGNHGIWAQVSGAGLSIHGNTIYNIGERGIQVNSAAINVNIDGNEIYGAAGYAGIVIDTGATGAKINNNYIHNNTGGGVAANAQTAEFNNNRILDNGFGVEMGASGATFVLCNNSIAGNDPDGSADHGVGSYSGLSVYAGSADASGNWWGSATGPYNLATNASGAGNAVSDNVDYSPWWGANYIGVANPWVWYVNQSNGSSIQEGIDTATAGDTVNVTAGTYSENLNIGKALTLTSPSLIVANNPVLQGAGSGTTGIIVSSDNVTISHLTIQGYETAIDVAAAYTHLAIENNYFNSNSKYHLRVPVDFSGATVYDIYKNSGNTADDEGVITDASNDVVEKPAGYRVIWAHVADAINNTSAGDNLDLFHQGDLNLSDTPIDTNGGNLNFTNKGLLTLGNTNTGSGSINITINGDPDLIIDGTVNSGGGDIDYDVLGFIEHTADGKVYTHGGYYHATAGNYYKMVAGSVIDTTGALGITGTVILRADTMDLAGAINAGTKDVTLRTNTVARPINLGTEVAASLNLTNTELNTITTSGQLVIGDSSHTGGVIIKDNINTTGVDNLKIITNSAINGTAAKTLTEPTLTLQGTSIGTALTRLLTATGNLTAVANAGDIYISNTESVAINLTGNNVNLISSGAITSGLSTTDVDTSELSGNITLSGTSIGANGSPIEVNPGSGNLSLTASTGGVYLDFAAGDLLTNKISTLNVAGIGQDIQFSTTDGTITINGTAGFNANTQNDHFTFATGGISKNVDFSGATTLTAASATLTATGAITSGTAATDINTSGSNGAITLSSAAIGAAGNSLSINPGIGSLSFTATSDDVFVNLSAGNLATSKITNLDVAGIGKTIQFSTGTGTINVDNISGFKGNVWDDSFIFTNAGALTIASGMDFNLTGSGSFTQNGAGVVSLGGNITTSGTPISFFRGITLINDVALSTGAGAGISPLAAP